MCCKIMRYHIVSLPHEFHRYIAAAISQLYGFGVIDVCPDRSHCATAQG